MSPLDNLASLKDPLFDFLFCDACKARVIHYKGNCLGCKKLAVCAICKEITLQDKEGDTISEPGSRPCQIKAQGLSCKAETSN